MLRLKEAQRQLKSWMTDMQAFRGCQPNEVVALAKVREALALIEEAELYSSPPESRAVPDVLREKIDALVSR